MDASAMLEKMSAALGSAANVKSVFGEPIHAEGKTVVPVARVAFGFGAGGGAKSADHNGGGGGGGVRAFPAGVLEITHNGTRFVAYPDLGWLAGAFAAGLVFGGLFLHHRRH
jgi:uncharacterized spore protein YtfJ